MPPVTTVRVPARLNAPWLFPVVAFVAVVAVLAAVVFLSSRIGADDLPPAAPAFEPPPAAALPPRYTVKQATGGTVSVLEDAVAGQGAPGSRELSPAPGTPIEVLRPVAVADIQPGDVVGVIGVPNGVRNFSIRTVVIYPTGTVIRDGGAASAAGFAGHEAAVDIADRVVMTAVVRANNDGLLTLDGAAGPVSLQLKAPGNIYRIGGGAVADLRPGDRLAVAGAGDAITAILVQPLR